jgi:hypothetical protein
LHAARETSPATKRMQRTALARACMSGSPAETGRKKKPGIGALDATSGLSPMSSPKAG